MALLMGYTWGLPNGLTRGLFSSPIGIISVLVGPNFVLARTKSAAEIASDEVKQVCLTWGSTPGNIPPSALDKLVEVCFLFIFSFPNSNLLDRFNRSASSLQFYRGDA